jgi:hypothetical protein
MEWIICDDGTDSIADLVADLPYVRYFRLEERLSLGKKRNFMHTKCSGDIIAYMDDDDYYPPQRISHGVEMLQKEKERGEKEKEKGKNIKGKGRKENPVALIGGCSMLYTYFGGKINSVYQCGPYGPYHATAASFIFWRQFLDDHQYSEEAEFGEESDFLQKFTVPLVQLDTRQTIVVFSHTHNSVNKEKMLTRPHETRMLSTNILIGDLIPDSELRTFYTTEMNQALTNYPQGHPKHKGNLMEEISNKRKSQAIQRAIADGGSGKCPGCTRLSAELKQARETDASKTELIRTLIERLRGKKEAVSEIIGNTQQIQGIDNKA